MHHAVHSVCCVQFEVMWYMHFHEAVWIVHLQLNLCSYIVVPNNRDQTWWAAHCFGGHWHQFAQEHCSPGQDPDNCWWADSAADWQKHNFSTKVQFIAHFTNTLATTTTLSPTSSEYRRNPDNTSPKTTSTTQPLLSRPVSHKCSLDKLDGGIALSHYYCNPFSLVW